MMSTQAKEHWLKFAQPPAAGTRQSRLILACFLGIMAIAAFFRLAWLDEAAFRADTIIFYNICGTSMSAADIYRQWTEFMKDTGQFPFSLAFTKGFLNVFGLPATHFTVRLPGALLGILTVAVAFAAGRRLGGGLIGLLLALLMALNPYHIQMSREAYFYAPLMLGATFSLWALVLAYDFAVQRLTMPLAFFCAVQAAGMFFTSQSSPAGLNLAIPFGLCVAGLMLWRLVRLRSGLTAMLVIAAVFALIGLHLLVTPWGWAQMKAIAANRERDVMIFTDNISNARLAWVAATSFAWGKLWPGVTLLLLTLALAAAFVAARIRSRPEWLFLPIIILAGFVLYVFTHSSTGAPNEPRYLAMLLPFFLGLLALGLAFLPIVVGTKERRRMPAHAAGVVLILASVACSLQPAYAAIRLTGRPTPYKEIQEWVNQNLQPGSLVLVDRWFEPWNELKVYESTNVFFTFTVPNEPAETYIKGRWRDTAKAFFEREPSAAYLEVARSYWDDKRIGPWDWPASYFARQVTFTNHAAFTLRHYGLANRLDYYAANSNRLIVTLYYNTVEDALERARAAGRQVALVYGSGWGYVKMQDYTGWRVLGARASVTLYNLGDSECHAKVFVAAVTPAESKHVRASTGERTVFHAGRPMKWELAPMLLKPGATQLFFDDPSGASSPLYVADVALQPIQPRQQGGAAQLPLKNGRNEEESAGTGGD